jgi:ABC-type nitrate/sulfonate/bicarbonate transport system ATPase subunit
MQPLLQINNLTMNFDSKDRALEVLKDISFSVMEGEFLCIVGPNGCGKTTLLHIIAGFLKPSSGNVMINGSLVVSPGPDRPIILQDLGLFYWMTVWDNVTFGLKVKYKYPEKVSEIANLWLKKLGLTGFEQHYPFELSGGMKQKLAIARAFVLNPEVLILDEPFANLDMQTREKMQEEISDLALSTKKTVLMVTHSIEEAVFLADRIIVLTRRPARIIKVVEINKERPRKPEFRLSKEFLDFKSQIWQLLKPNKED